MQPEWLDKDYYKDLGLPATASDNEIKKTYRKLARELHPDANPGDKKAEERFKKVSEAYSVLGDPKKRKKYDETKEMAKNGMFNQSGGSYGGGGTRFTTQNFDLNDLFGGGATTGGYSRSSGGGGFSDIFGGLFGNSGGNEYAGGRRSRQAPLKGQDVQANYTVNFKDAALGSTVSLQVPQADGTNKKVTVKIPAGVENGGKIKIPGKGYPGPQGAPAGDLYLTVNVVPDKLFSQQGNNLKLTAPVAFTELALGAVITVPTLEGGHVSLKIPAGADDGKIFRVKGKGINKPKQGTGDLLVQVKVKVPTSLNPEAKKLLEQYAEVESNTGFNPRANWA